MLRKRLMFGVSTLCLSICLFQTGCGRSRPEPTVDTADPEYGQTIDPTENQVEYTESL